MSIIKIVFTIYLFCLALLCEAQNNEKSILAMNPLKNKTYKVKVGQQLSFDAKVHGSVGYDANAEIEDEKIVKLVSEDLKFKNNSEDIMPGADEAVRFYIFEAIQKGKTKIKIKQIFRGKIEKTYTFNIQVQ